MYRATPISLFRRHVVNEILKTVVCSAPEDFPVGGTNSIVGTPWRRCPATLRALAWLSGIMRKIQDG